MNLDREEIDISYIKNFHATETNYSLNATFKSEVHCSNIIHSFINDIYNNGGSCSLYKKNSTYDVVICKSRLSDGNMVLEFETFIKKIS